MSEHNNNNSTDHASHHTELLSDSVQDHQSEPANSPSESINQTATSAVQLSSIEQEQSTYTPESRPPQQTSQYSASSIETQANKDEILDTEQPNVEQQGFYQQQPNVEQQGFYQQQPQAEQQSFYQQQPQSEQQSFYQQQPQSEQQSFYQQQPQAQQQGYYQQQPQAQQQGYYQQQPQAQQQGYYQQYNQQYGYYPQARKTNDNALAAFILSICSIFLPFIGFICAVIALFLGPRGLKQISQREHIESGRVFAIIGIVASSLVLFFYFLFILFFIFALQV